MSGRHDRVEAYNDSNVPILVAEFYALANETGIERTPNSQRKFILKYRNKLDDLIEHTSTAQYFEIMGMISKRLGSGGRPQVNKWLEDYGFNNHRF